jgi:tetratricopeptide (TPR) repeat protein
MTAEQDLLEIKGLIDQGGGYHRQGRHAFALRCYQKAITLARPLDDNGLIAYLLAEAGSEHRDCDNYHHAADLLVAALAIVPNVESTLELRGSIKKLLAIVFEDIFGPQKPEVLKLLDESRQDYVRSSNVGQEANVLQHIGGCYIQLGRFAEADRVLTEALRKAAAASDVQLQGWIYDNMADLEIERNNWGQALEYTRTARDRAQAAQDLEGEGDTWVNEARVLLRMGHDEDALVAAHRALAIFIENQNLRRTIHARRQIAKGLVRLKRVDEALAALNEAMQTAARLDLRRDQTIVHLDLGQIELERQNYGLAHGHGVNARALADAEGLNDIVGEADDLLRRCYTKERLGE